MYLHISLIQCCRYLCGNRCICTPLIFIVADALFGINVSVTCFSSNLQILFSLPGMYNCIYISPFLKREDASHWKYASLLALSMPCRYFPQKFCILNPLKSTIADIAAHYSLSPIPLELEPIHYLQKNWYKKSERIWNERWWHLERKFLR